MKLNRSVFFAVYLLFCVVCIRCNSVNLPYISTTCTPNKLSYLIMQGASGLMKETVELHGNLLSVQSARILTALTPLYVTTRSIDCKIHCKFYDKIYHKNINQPHSVVCNAIEKAAIVGIAGLSSLALFSPDEELRITSRIFALGAASGLLAKNVIKKMRCNANLRPWNEHFSSEKRSYGGFPSGHMFEAAYMTTVYGLQYGLKAGIPLGIFSGAMLGVSIACNRHYVSQTIAGVGLGIIYGVAAHRLIEKKIAEEIAIDFCSDNQGFPSIKLAYYF